MDAEWWLEPDVYYDGSDVIGPGARQQLFASEWGDVFRRKTRNFHRAKLYCYECPLLVACRERSWDEPSHIFGGLSPVERYNARRDGQSTITKPDESPRPPLSKKARRVQELLIAGHSTEEVSRVLQIDDPSVLKYTYQAVLAARDAREREETWEKPPPLPLGLSLRSYQRGLGSSSGSMRESA